MTHWRSIKFWLLLFVGWLIASTFSGVLARLFVSFDQMTSREVWIAGVSIHVLAVLAGFSFARTRMRRDSSSGSPVVVKSDGEPDPG